MNFKYLSVALAFTALVSCSDKLADKPGNKYGTPGRTNCYEEFGDLRYNLINAKKITAKDTSGASIAPLMLANTKLAVATNNGSLQIIKNGELLSEEKIDDNAMPASAMCSSPTGKIFVQCSNGKIYIFDENGKKQSQLNLVDTVGKFEIFSDLLASDDGIYAGSSRGLVAKIGFDGKKIWEKNFNLPVIKTFATTASGDLVIGLTNNEFGASDRLVVLSKSGELKLNKELPGARIAHYIATSKDIIYVPQIMQANNERTSKISAFDLSGNLKWEQTLPLLCKHVSVDEEGSVYIAGVASGAAENQTGIYRFNAQGSQQWQIYLRISIEAPVLVGKKTIALMGASKFGPAMLYLYKETGVMFKDISLADFPSFLYSPTVDSDASIYFGFNSGCGVVEIKETFVNKLLPF